MDNFRYINNTDSDITVGDITVPAWDQVMFTEDNKQLNELVPNRLIGLKNGVPFNVPVVEQKVQISELELHGQESSIVSHLQSEPVPEVGIPEKQSVTIATTPTPK